MGAGQTVTLYSPRWTAREASLGSLQVIPLKRWCVPSWTCCGFQKSKGSSSWFCETIASRRWTKPWFVVIKLQLEHKSINSNSVDQNGQLWSQVLIREREAKWNHTPTLEKKPKRDAFHTTSGDQNSLRCESKISFPPTVLFLEWLVASDKRQLYQTIQMLLEHSTEPYLVFYV